MAPWWRPRARAEQRLAKEIAFHLAERVAELVAGGMPTDEADRQARRELGPLDPILEGCRDQRWWRGLDDLVRDGRYALRALRHAPVFTIVALLTLTLGIGANAALFQVYEALELRALPGGRSGLAVAHPHHAGTPRNGNFMGRQSLSDLGAGGRAAPHRHRRRTGSRRGARSASTWRPAARRGSSTR